MLFKLQKKGLEVYRFVQHDIDLVVNKGPFKGTKHVIMRFENEARQLKIGHFNVIYDREFLTFIPVWNEPVLDCIRNKKKCRQNNPLKMGFPIIPKYKYYFWKLISFEVGYVHLKVMLRNSK
ncbi:hypothetical protein D6_0025 [Aeromonas phage D6]|uniref:Uncharacterized protein n=1 Tax=Aeromonas phage D6 TaxID=2593322 RepID=A0A514TVX6_9CAUD|nr:hypothetical protein PQC08_gp250 [Aeromonas phage D6]QDJ97185.1 hypothetical protein D6_0025 [Aeromonas phage D6]